MSRGVRCPGGARASPSGWECRFPSCVPPSWFRTTSAVYSSVTLRPCCMPLPIMGFTAFLSVAKQRSPPCTLLPFEAFPPPTAAVVRDESRSPRARVTAATVAGRRVHREPCLPVLSLSPVLRASLPLQFPAADTFRHIVRMRAWDPEALLHRRVRCAPGRFRPTMLGAPLGLAGSFGRAPSVSEGLLRRRRGLPVGESRTNERPTSRQRPLRRALSSV